MNALRESSCHYSGLTSACIGLSLLLYISLYSRQSPASSACYKCRAEGRPGCTILCILAKEVQVWGQSTAVSSGRFLGSIPWIPWMSDLVNRAQEGSLVACTRKKKNDASVPKWRCRDFGPSGVAAYIVAAWLAAEGRERCVEGEELVQNWRMPRSTRRRPDLHLRGRCPNPTRIWCICCTWILCIWRVAAIIGYSR